MASRVASPLSPSSNQFRQKPVHRAKLRKAQGHNRALRDSWKKRRTKQAIRVRQKSLKRTPLKRAGRKTKEWDHIRAVLKKRFRAAGITTCEIREPGCFGDNGLGFLHYDKRRFLTPAELWIVALGCAHCHDIYELKPRPEMKKAVLKIIAARSVQP